MSSELVLIEKNEHIAQIILNRAEKRNALNKKLFVAIKDAFLSLQLDSEVRVVILSGAELNGSRVFSAGIDVFELGEIGQSQDLTSIRKYAELLQSSFNAVESLEKPVIAVIDGYCFGAGLELALACDFRIMSSTAKIGALETSLGIIPDLGGTTRLVKILGTSKAKKIIMFAERYSAQEALELNLVDWVVPSTEIMNEAIKKAQKLMKNAPLALGIAKRLIDNVSGLDLQTSLLIEKLSQFELIRSKDTTEAVVAMLEKRKPIFKGK